jgi:hypothetical protein
MYRQKTAEKSRKSEPENDEGEESEGESLKKVAGLKTRVSAERQLILVPPERKFTLMTSASYPPKKRSQREWLLQETLLIR